MKQKQQIKIIQIPVLTDNFIYILHDTDTNTTAVIDPAVAEPVTQIIRSNHWNLDMILNTHHHPDHVGANLELKQTFGCRIIGPKKDAKRIPGIDHGVIESDSFEIGSSKAEVLELDGHTIGHIGYRIGNSLFSGDTLFSLGCGRLFEGTPKQMVQSLEKIAALPEQTEIFCTHEYTLANSNFTTDLLLRHKLTVEAEQFSMIAQQVTDKRQSNQSTVPSLLSFEKRWNIFLKIFDADFIGKFNFTNAVDAFTYFRKQKDDF